MKLKKHPNRKKFTFPVSPPKAAETKNIDYNLYFTIIGFIVGSGAMLMFSFNLLYRTFQKLPVYQKGKFVNMSIIEKSEPYGSRRNPLCTIKLYYDERIYSEHVNNAEYSNYKVGDDLPRRFLKGNPIILEPNDTLLGEFTLNIFLILLFGFSFIFLIKMWYNERN
jgi:hypothetical protein